MHLMVIEIVERYGYKVNPQKIKQLLKDVKAGVITTEEAFLKLKNLPFEDIDFAKIDHHRSLRQGFTEVIYCEGKTPSQVVSIMEKLQMANNNVIATRASIDIFNKVYENFPQAEWYERSRVILLRKGEQKAIGNILVMCAGTSDLPVAEETILTAEAMGNKVTTLFDVGVAGLHRLLSNLEKLSQAKVIIVIAGMEGALPSVVSGLVDKPVIAVPTSVGYGTNFGGVSSLLTMLNSCSSGISVVNIDNGFGAGYAASLINRIGEQL
jgi:NCAIR mutase (PurE)-related protein